MKVIHQLPVWFCICGTKPEHPGKTHSCQLAGSSCEVTVISMPHPFPPQMSSIYQSSKGWPGDGGCHWAKFRVHPGQVASSSQG